MPRIGHLAKRHATVIAVARGGRWAWRLRARSACKRPAARTGFIMHPRPSAISPLPVGLRRRLSATIARSFAAQDARQLIYI
ncbi:hypothetical protein IE4771_PB00301 (plasmid) [Rhizobium etli bv. mimosae str. IE4771]|uniref:Uncharacterized protein n=1 Tax=Rhizobium etli bv. mimosae str. IE4771 TaxID=1432050 RepID=A0A060I8J8_RHIET|nr:hypothetical protein IE4771_PB00301 [Rhizobium sp. IE4771]